jgi:hypothetical protein
MWRHSRFERWAWANPWKWSSLCGLAMFAFQALLMFGFNLRLGGSVAEGLLACVTWGLAWFAMTAARYVPTPRWIRRRHS